MPLISHIVLPGQVIAEADSRARETVASFLRRTGWSTTNLPTVCVINGAPVMRADWRKRRILKRDTVQFQSRPRGGGGSTGSNTKSVVGLVGVIALSLLSPVVGALFGAAGSIAYGLGSGAFVAGASFLLSTLLAPAAAQSKDTQQPSMYAFGQQTNSAKPLEPIPVRYGRTKSIPSYAALPWSEFIGDDQYLNLLLVHGLGRYRREQILIEDTILWDYVTGLSSGFEGVEFQFCEPGEDVTLFPLNVAASIEVAGQELADEATWVGGFIANASGTTANALALDFVLPQGLYIQQANGNLGQYLCSITAEYRPVNAMGTPTGPFVQLFQDQRWGSTKKPLRFSVKVEVPPGRYEVRAKRDIPEDFNSNKADQIIWAGLRAFLTGPRSFDGVTVTAIRMKSSAQLTQASSGRFGVIDTRILPVWTGVAWDEQPTRSPAYAAQDIATNLDYGSRRPASKVDTQAIVDLAGLAAARGDCFDYEFSSIVPATDAIDTALAPARAKHRWLGDVLSLVRDEWQPLPSMLLTDREIIRGSFSADYLLQAEDASDAVIVEYLDETTWRVEEVQVPDGVSPQFAARVQIPGIVQREQAFREAKFLWRQNAFRRVRPSVSTEHDGRLLSVGSVITLQSEIPMSWGSAGAVVGRSGLTLTLNPAPAWEVGQSYILLRSPTGEPFGPVKISRSGDDAHGLLDATDLALVEGQQGWALDAVLARHEGSEPPSFAFGLGTEWQQRCIVMSGAPDGDQVRLELVVDYEDVHDDSGDPGTVPPAASLNIPKNPLVRGLIASLQQNVLEPVLSASWVPADGALYYIAQVSYDGRATWAPLAQVYAPSLSVVVEARALSLRVAAVGVGQGAWSVVDVAAPTIDASLVPGLASVIEIVNSRIGQAFEQYDDALLGVNDAVTIALAAIENLRIDSVTMAEAKTAQVSKRLTVVEAQNANWGAQISDLELAMVTADGALATRIGTVSATGSDNLSAAVVAEQTARANAVSAIGISINSIEARMPASNGAAAAATKLAALIGGDGTTIAMSTTDLATSYNGLQALTKITAVSSAVSGFGATSSIQLQTIAGSSLSGLHLVSTTAGQGFAAIEASKFLLLNPGGAAFAVFDIVGGNVYLKGNLFLAGTLDALAISINGIPTDRLANNAVTEYVTAYADSAATLGSTVDIHTVSINVQAGKSVELCGGFFTGMGDFSVTGSNHSLLVVRLDFEILRGSTVVHTRSHMMNSNVTGGLTAQRLKGDYVWFAFTDTPPAGSHSYTFRVTGFFGTDGAVTGTKNANGPDNISGFPAWGYYKRFMRALTFKR